MRSPLELTRSQVLIVALAVVAGAVAGYLVTLQAPYPKALGAMAVLGAVCGLAALVTFCSAVAAEVPYTEPCDTCGRCVVAVPSEHPERFYREVQSWQA